MASIKDTFNDLKSKVIGTKTAKVDDKLDRAIKDIVNYKSNSGRAGMIDLLNSLISKNGSGQVTNNNLSNGLFGMGGSNTPSAMGQGNRLARYQMYESIVGTISYCNRALSVLVDNILAPDDITKFSLEVTENDQYTEGDLESKVNEIKNLIKDVKLEKKLHLLIRNTLMYGDYFIEIADDKTALESKSSILNESVIQFDQPANLSESMQEFTYKLNENQVKVSIDYSAYVESETKPEKMEYKDVKLLMYDPKRVVKLQSQMFPICFGYLVFPLTTIVPQLSAEEQSINDLCVNILKKIEEKVPQIKDLQNNDDLVSVIGKMIKDAKGNNVQIRYVPADKMQHFTVPSSKFYPYGESVFDPTVYTAKVLIALETALAIQRLNRSTEKRKVMVELGLPRDAKELVDNIKNEFKKRKVSLDDLGAVDTIPSMITTFEDIYIPQKDGKPFVDIQTMTEGNVDIRSKVDELKFLRDQLVASLGIPPAFLNIEENLSNKAALAEENILFARTIISHQKYLSDQVNQLVEKIYDIVRPDDVLDITKRVQVAFPPPKSLQFERQARYMSELANLVRTLEEIGVPKEWSRKKYLTSIDWDDVEKFQTTAKIEKEAGTNDDKEDDGMGGMGGGGMGGF